MNIEVSAVASNDDPLYVNVLPVYDSFQAQNTIFLIWNWIQSSKYLHKYVLARNLGSNHPYSWSFYSFSVQLAWRLGSDPRQLFFSKNWVFYELLFWLKVIAFTALIFDFFVILLQLTFKNLGGFLINHTTVVRKFSVALVVLRRGCFSRSKQTDDGSMVSI